jgi:hypothetical protein
MRPTASFSDDDSPCMKHGPCTGRDKKSTPSERDNFPFRLNKKGFQLRSAFCPLQYRLRLVDDLNSRAVLQYRTKNKKQIPLFFLVNNYMTKSGALFSCCAASVYSNSRCARPGGKNNFTFLSIIKFPNHRIQR